MWGVGVVVRVLYPLAVCFVVEQQAGKLVGLFVSFVLLVGFVV